jgi:hypothetical protein
MIDRKIHDIVIERLTEAPAVALIGPRQVGKTTLAQRIADTAMEAVYLDLEQPGDRALLADPAPRLSRGFHAGCEDLEPFARLLVYPGPAAFPAPNGAEAMSINAAAKWVAEQ